MKSFILQTTFDPDYKELLLKIEDYCLKFSDRDNDYSNDKLISSLFLTFESNLLRICEPKSQTEEFVDNLKVLLLQYLFQTPLIFDNDETKESSVQQLYAQYITENMPPAVINGGMHIVVYMNPHSTSDVNNITKLINVIPQNIINSVTVDVILTPVIFDHDITKEETVLIKANLNNLIKLKSDNENILGNIFYCESIDNRGAVHVMDFHEEVKLFGRLLLAYINGYNYLTNDNKEYPLTIWGINSVQIDKFDIINSWSHGLLQKLISPVIEKKDDNYIIDNKKIQGILNQILDKEKQLITQLSDSKNNIQSLSDEYKERVLEILLQNDLNPKEKKYLLDSCLTISNRDFESLETLDITDIPLPDELFIEQLKEFNDDVHYADLMKVISRIQDLKKIIENSERQVCSIKDLIDKNYPFDGSLTDDGFNIHGQIFKPYTYKEEPLESDYTPSKITTETSADLRQYFSKIKSQGTQGACASFSLVSVFEYFMANDSEPIDLSEAYVYYNAREQSGDTDMDKGTTLHSIIKAMTDNGVCIEELCPYDENIYDKKPNEEAYRDGLKRKVNAAKNVPIDVNIIKSAIMDGYPVAASFRVFDSFAKNVGGFVTMPSEQEKAIEKKEYHAMVICGFNDQQGFFIVRNSWGTQFGDKGYCYIPYAYVRDPELTTYACAITGVDVNAVKHVATQFKYDIKSKDNNIKYVVLNNQLLEEQQHLAKNKEDLRRLYDKYIEILKSIKNGDCMTYIRKDLDSKIINKRQYVQKLKEKQLNYVKPICKKSIKIAWMIITMLSVIASGCNLLLHYRSNNSWTLTIIGAILFVMCMVCGIIYLKKRYRNKKMYQDIQVTINAMEQEISKLEKQYQSKIHTQGVISKILDELDVVADNSIKRKKMMIDIDNILSDVYQWILDELGVDDNTTLQYYDLYKTIVEKLKNKWDILKSLFVDEFDLKRIKDGLHSIQREILQEFNQAFNIRIEDYYGVKTDNWKIYRKAITNTPILSQVELTGDEPGLSIFLSNIDNVDISHCFPVYVNNNQYLYILLQHVNINNLKLYKDNK